MNDRALAYLVKHGVLLEIDGVSELVLPLEKVQGFLDLIQPSDVPPDKLQKLYAYQAELVKTVREHFQQPDRRVADVPDDIGDEKGDDAIQ